MTKSMSEIRKNGPIIGSAILLGLALLLGGASRDAAVYVALLELCALAVLFGLIWSPQASSGATGADLGGGAKAVLKSVTSGPVGLFVALFALLLLQLVPLPPAIWATLPGRADAKLALDLAGIPIPWAPLSLTPEQTWASLLALLPPFAVFLAVQAASLTWRLRLVAVVVVMTLLGLCLGGIQIAGGSGAGFYLWDWATRGQFAGFFANRNHMATLCLMALPLLTALCGAAIRRKDGGLVAWSLGLGVGLIVVSLGVIRSRAGLSFALPVMAGSLLVAWLASGRRLFSPVVLGVMGVATAAAAAVAAFALPPILARFEPDVVDDARFEEWPLVFDTAQAYLPFGTGVGAFDPVFRSVEPLERLNQNYFNHAHNDYLELWLETGWLGVFLVAGFLIWFGRRTLSAWRSGPGIDGDLARAASVAIAAVLAHSFFDYPLRTEAIAVTFALCCGLLEFAGRGQVSKVVSSKRNKSSRRGHNSAEATAASDV